VFYGSAPEARLKAGILLQKLACQAQERVILTRF
jgi:hypothetical protein